MRPRIQPLEAARIITDDIVPHFEAVPIGKEDYVAALNLVGNGGWSGAKIYDALLIQCAARCSVDRIYSFIASTWRTSGSLPHPICARRYRLREQGCGLDLERVAGFLSYQEKEPARRRRYGQRPTVRRAI